MSQPLRIHLLIPDPAGPVESGRHEWALGVLGTGWRWRAACDPAVVLDHQNLGTEKAYGVRCQACLASEAYRALPESEKVKPHRIGKADRTEETGHRPGEAPCQGC